MKIGIVVYPTFGGSGVVGTELGKALAEKGHQIHFITYSLPVKLGSFRENIYYHEVAVNDYPLFEYQPYETALASKLVDVVQFEKLDVLHVHYAIPHASAAYMAKQILSAKGIEIPFITTLHGTDITLVGKDPSFEPVITFCLNESSVVTAVSESLKDETYQFFDVRREIKVIPNFVVKEQQSENQYAHLRCKYADSKERILCHVSNFRKVKRVEDVVLVFNEVRKVVPSKLILVGDGPERQSVERLVRELDLMSDVKFLGNVVDTSHVLEIVDLFVLPSEKESFGLAALEAMAVGVPVISSNTGGIPEVNTHGFSGFLSCVGDIDDMAKNAIQILKDDETLNKFKMNAMKRSFDFSLEKILPMYEAIYEELIS